MECAVLNSESRKSELSENFSCEPGDVALSANRGNEHRSATHVLADDVVALAARVDRAGGGDGSVALTAEWQVSTRRLSRGYDVRYDNSRVVPSRVLVDHTLEESLTFEVILARYAAAVCELRQRQSHVPLREVRRRTNEVLLTAYGIDRGKDNTCVVSSSSALRAVLNDAAPTDRHTLRVPNRVPRPKPAPNVRCSGCGVERAISRRDAKEGVGRYCTGCRRPLEKIETVERDERRCEVQSTTLVAEVLQRALDIETDAAVYAQAEVGQDEDIATQAAQSDAHAYSRQPKPQHSVTLPAPEPVTPAPESPKVHRRPLSRRALRQALPQRVREVLNVAEKPLSADALAQRITGTRRTANDVLTACFDLERSGVLSRSMRKEVLCWQLIGAAPPAQPELTAASPIGADSDTVCESGSARARCGIASS